MIRFRCPQCRAKMESPLSLAGESDKCPQCGCECPVPSPNTPKKRSFLILAGGQGQAPS